MAIQVNIDGVTKTVTQPKVNIGGTWKAVNKVQNNIDGVWKTSFELLTIKIYRYGSLYQTLTVVKGNSVKLPSLGIGFATASGSTTTTYNSGATITPTGNMTLYAVFSYSLKIYQYGSLYTTLTSKSQSSTGSFTLPNYGVGYATSSSSTTVSYSKGETLTTSGKTLYIVYEYSIKLYKYGSLYQTLTSKSQSSTASFTLPTCTPNTGESFYGWTKTSGGSTKDYASGASVTTSGMSLYAIFSITSSNTETVTDGATKTITVSTSGTVTIMAYCTYNGYQTGGALGDTLYSSTDNNYCTINGKYITGSSASYSDNIVTTVSINANDVIKIHSSQDTLGGSSNGYSTTYKHYVKVQYPTITYRSTK